MKTLIQSLLVVTLLSGCASTTTDTANNVETLNQQFIQAWNSKDADKITTFLADDVQFLQGATRFSGKAQVSDKWVRATLPTIENLRLSPTTSGSDDAMAYQAGTYSVDVLPAAPGEPRGEGEGNFTLLWRKAQDNTWKLSLAQLEGLPVEAKQ